MSLFTGTVLRPQPTLFRLSAISSRPFRNSAARAALSESDHNDDARKKAIDEHKDDQLDKQKRGKGHWKRELSSNSESAVKADRQEINDAEHDISELQKQTSEALEDGHEHGKK